MSMFKKPLFTITTTALFLTTVGSCNQPAVKAQGQSKSKSNTVYIMTYNVENLFDTQDDPKKDDSTFLPYSLKKTKKHRSHCARLQNYKWKKQCFELDWNKKAYQTKLENIAHVISLQNNAQGPDILFLQEVENIQVLRELNAKLSNRHQFKTISLIEGHDTRGIDVAVMSKLTLTQSAKLFRIPFKSISNQRKKDTRGILHAEFMLPNGKRIATYSVHFPAPYHPKYLRQQALSYLNQLKEKYRNADYHVAAGDFNITRSESQRTLVFEKIAQKEWLTPHLTDKKYAQTKRLGSNYYARKKSWSFLDTILLSKNFDDQKAWEYQDNSFSILNNAFIMQNENKQPKSYNFATGQGVSDHFPVGLAIKYLP